MKKSLLIIAVLALATGCEREANARIDARFLPTAAHESRYVVYPVGQFDDGLSMVHTRVFSVSDSKTGERWLLFSGARGLAITKAEPEAVGGGK